MLTGTVPAAEIRRHHREAPDWAAELAALEDLEIVELNSGHWPQFSMPERLGAAILAAVDRDAAPDRRASIAGVSGPSPGRRRRG